MDTSEYLSMFLAESREHLQTLNLAVIRIEENPQDAETVDEIFRIAHSLKGMSGTMGFASMAALTHKMEDVFETLRGRSEPLERRVVDVLLECLDALEGAVESIESSGSEQLAHEPLVARLGELVGEQAAAAAAPADVPPDGPQPPAEVAARFATDRVLALAVTLSDDVMMPAVRAFMALSAAADLGEVLYSVPTADDIEGFEGRRVHAWLSTEHEVSTVRDALCAVPDVAAADVSAAGESAAPAARPAPALAVEAPAVEVPAPETPAAETPPDKAPATAPAPASAPAAPGQDRAPAARKLTGTVRVDAERLDALMHYMGELVVHRTRVESLAGQVQLEGLSEAVQDLTRSSQALQAMVMQVRMIEVDAVFMRFPRLVRDLSSKLSKHVELVLTGRDTELDRTVVDALGDPLVHLVRNSLDHGMETPEERVAAGKPETGTVEIAARHAGGNVVITVRDDGRGVNPARVAAKAAERGLIPADQIDAVDMPRAIELLFEPGFSTMDATSDISGRGVGMDAVRNAIRGLGGAVVMTSEQGAGTTVQIRLPLTLAIMPALLVEAGGVPFAIPLERVERTLNLSEQTVRSVTGKPMLVLDDGVLSLLDLAKALHYRHDVASGFVVIARGDDRRLALAVDRLIGQHELVTRPLPAELGDATALSGGAVLSDGTIALIVDCDALADQTGSRRPAADVSLAA